MVLEGLFSGFTNGAAGWINGLQIFLWVTSIGLLFYAVWHFMSYKIKVRIHSPKSWGRAVEFDRARIKKARNDKSVQELVLLRNKDAWIGPLDDEFWIPARGMFGRIKYEVDFIRDGKGNLQALPRVDETAIDNTRRATASDKKWIENEVTHSIEKFQNTNWWENPVIWNIAGLAIVFVMFLVLIREIGPLADSFNAAAQAFAEAQRNVTVIR